MKIVSYKPGSKSAKALSEKLGIKRIKHEGKPINVRGTLINWGCSRLPERVRYGNILNTPEAIARAANKLLTFQTLSEAGVNIPVFTTDRNVALEWVKDGQVAVCRTILNGHSGQGIVLAGSEEELVDAPLYTLYKKKDQEYRLHVFRGEVFFVQRKARKKEVPDEEVNWQIRNHDNGFIFAHQDVDVDGAVKNTAVRALEALGLDFGAMDILTTKKGEHCLLEANTACGLEGTTLDKYVEIFKEFK